MIYQIPPRNFAGKDICAYWDNFLTNDQINHILALPEWFNSTDASVGGQARRPEDTAIDQDIRSSKVAWLHYNDETSGLWERISDVIAEVNSEFFHFDLTGMYEPMQLTIYTATETAEDHYTWHTDMSMSDKGVPRKLSMSLLLSDPDDFEGGDLQVKTDGDTINTLEAEKGRAWFFPSWVLHRVTPVTRGVRRSLVVWIGGPPFK